MLKVIKQRANAEREDLSKLVRCVPILHLSFSYLISPYTVPQLKEEQILSLMYLVVDCNLFKLTVSLQKNIRYMHIHISFHCCVSVRNVW